MLLPLLLNNLLSGGGAVTVTLNLGVDTPVKVEGLSSILNEDTVVLKPNVTLTLGSRVAIQLAGQTLTLTSKAAVQLDDVTLSLNSASAVMVEDLTATLGADTGVGTYYLTLACSAAIQSMSGGFSQSLILRPKTVVRAEITKNLTTQAAVQDALRSIALSADSMVSSGILKDQKKSLYVRTVVRASQLLQLGADAGIADPNSLSLDATAVVEAAMTVLLASRTAVSVEDNILSVAAESAVAFTFTENLTTQTVVKDFDVAKDLAADTHVLSNLYLAVDAAIGLDEQAKLLFPDTIVALRLTKDLTAQAAVSTLRSRPLPVRAAIRIDDNTADLDTTTVVFGATTLALDTAAAVVEALGLNLPVETAIQAAVERELLCAAYVLPFAPPTLSLGADSAIADQILLNLAVAAQVAFSREVALASGAAVAWRFTLSLGGTAIVRQNDATATLQSKTAVRVTNSLLALAMDSAIRLRPALSLGTTAGVFTPDRAQTLGATVAVRGAKPAVPRTIPYGTRRV